MFGFHIRGVRILYNTHTFTQTQLIELRTTNYQLKEDQQKLVTGDNLTHTPIIVLYSIHSME